MDRQLDPHLQRIIDNAAGASRENLQERNYRYAAEHQWGFDVAPRQPSQDFASLSDFG